MAKQRDGLALILCLALVVSFPTASAPGDPPPRSKQKGRIRNTPDVEATPSGHWNVSEELNFFAAQGIANTTVDYGLPTGGWNLGFSLLNAGFYAAPPATLWIEPDALFNLEKHFLLGQGWTAIVGTQTGAAFFHTGSTRLMDFSYVDSHWLHPQWGTELHLGGYYANATMAGRESAGWRAGMELPLIRDKLVLEGDYLSGRNNVGGATVKLTYSLTPRWQMSFGVQVPAAHTGNDFSGLLGVYWNN